MGALGVGHFDNPTLELLSEAPARAPAGAPLLFVHGAWHGAWCWRNFLPHFARRGHPAFALSLRGHGGSASERPLRALGVRDYVDDVAGAIARLPAPPVLVAHSMGAFVVHHLLQRRPAVAGVVLLAPVPPGGAWRATWHAARHHPAAFVRVNVLRRLLPMVETVERAHDVLFSRGTPRAEVEALHPLLQDESYRAYLGMLLRPVRRPLAATHPTLVLGAAEDRIIDGSDVRATARHYGCEHALLPGLGHDLMLEPRWPEVAARLSAWLHAQGLGPA